MSTPDKQRAYQRIWIAKRRQDWITSQGGKCIKCGSTENLEIDHIDPKTKTMHIGTIWSRRKEIREAELAKCQVLCYDCHKTKTRNEVPEPIHGSPTKYRNGCKCELCKAYKQADNKTRYKL